MPTPGANISVDLYKLVNTTQQGTYPATPDVSGIEGYLESVSGEILQVLGNNANVESFYLYIDPEDIHVGDKLVGDDGYEYRVAGVERHENNPDTDDVYKLTVNRQHVEA